MLYDPTSHKLGFHSRNASSNESNIYAWTQAVPEDSGKLHEEVTNTWYYTARTLLMLPCPLIKVSGRLQQPNPERIINDLDHSEVKI